MPNLEWALRCDYAFFDGQGKACLIGLFNRIWADSFPATHSLLFVVSNWIGDANETFSQHTRIMAPDGSQVAESRVPEVTASPAGGAGIITRFANITFPEPGDYRIELLANDIVAGSVGLILAPRQ